MKRYLTITLCGIFVLALSPASFAEADRVIVTAYVGEVKVFPAGESVPSACKPGMLLKEGTRIITGNESSCELALDRARKNTVNVKANTEVVVKFSGDDRLELIDGKMFIMLRDLEKGKAFRVRTPDAVCGARGTGWLMDVVAGTTTISVVDSTVFVRGIKKDGTVMEQEFRIEEGFVRVIRRGENPEKAEKIPADKFAGMLKDAGISDVTFTEIEKKLRIATEGQKRREEQMKRLQEKKEEERLDKLTDRKDDERRSNSGDGDRESLTGGDPS
jgi:hypothetical protein